MKIPIIYKDPFIGRYTLGWQRISKSGNKILDIDQLFKDINDKKCSVDDIDWRGQFKEIERVHKAIKKSTTYCWLYPFLFQIQDSKLRNEVLQYLRYGSASILNRNEDYEFCIDCDCMEKVFQHVKKLPTFGYLLKKDPPKEKEWLIRLALTFEDTYIEIYPQRFVALIQEIYNEDEKGNRMDKISSIFRSVLIIGDLSINNCIDFCKYMLIAEDYRQWLITDNSSTKQPNLESLHRKLRNKCFDIYIQFRFREVQAELDDDNTLKDDPTDIQVYDKLYSDEYNWVRQEIENHPDKVDVIELAKYLLERIEPNTSHVSTQTQSGIPININGDIVLGNKQVGTHIDNVSSNAIGAKTQE